MLRRAGGRDDEAVELWAGADQHAFDNRDEDIGDGCGRVGFLRNAIRSVGSPIAVLAHGSPAILNGPDDDPPAFLSAAHRRLALLKKRVRREWGGTAETVERTEGPKPSRVKGRIKIAVALASSLRSIEDRSRARKAAGSSPRGPARAPGASPTPAGLD